MALADDYLDLFGSDEEAARNKAMALAQAMRQRRAAGDLGTILGGPFQEAGQQFGSQANQMQQQLVGAAQHRAQIEAENKRYAVEAARAAAAQQHWQTMEDLAAQGLGLKKNERMPLPSPYGGSVSVPKYGPAPGGSAPGSLLPGATGAAGGAGMGMPTDAMLDQQADLYAATGKLPPMRGPGGPALQRAIMERAAKKYPGASLAQNQAGYHADTASLQKQQQLLDLTSSWEATGKANLNVLRNVSQQLANAGSPLANRPLRYLFEKVGGDPTVTKFKAAHAAVVNEYAKILSGSTGNAGVTDASRREAEGMMPLDATPAQIAAAADLLETDAGNRLAALRAGVAATKGRTAKVGELPAEPAPEPVPPTASKALSDTDRQALEWLQKNPKAPQAAEVRKLLEAKGVKVP